jgi:hypothetical protein
MELFKFIISLKNFLQDYFLKQHDILSDILNIIGQGGDSKGILCKKIYAVICIIIIYIAVLYIFLNSLILTILYIYSIFVNLFKNNKTLEDDIRTLQAINTIYITPSVSLDKNMFAMFIMILLSIACMCYIYYISSIIAYKKWPYLTVFIIISFIILVIYFLLYFSTINRISLKNYNLMNEIYSYINYKYLTKGAMCNYLDKGIAKAASSNYNFIEGKCNNPNITNDNLNKYITIELLHMAYSVDITDTTISKESLKNIESIKGIKHYDNIINALITHALATYLKTVDSTNEKVKDFFSLSNILNNNFIESLFKYRINPFLSISRDNINILNYEFPTDLIPATTTETNLLNIKNSKLLKYIKQDYDKIKNMLAQNIIEFIYLTDTLTPSAYYYTLILLFGFILLTVNYFKSG